jgi:hypothetical protein
MTMCHRSISLFMVGAFLCAVVHAQSFDPRIAPVDASAQANAASNWGFQPKANAVSSPQTFNANTSVDSHIAPADDSSHANVAGVTQQQSGANTKKPSAASTWGPQPLTRAAAGPKGANIADPKAKLPTAGSRAQVLAAKIVVPTRVLPVPTASDEGRTSPPTRRPMSKVSSSSEQDLPRSHRAGLQKKKQRRQTAARNVRSAQTLSSQLAAAKRYGGVSNAPGSKQPSASAPPMAPR